MPYNNIAIYRISTYNCWLLIFFSIAVLTVAVRTWLQISQPLLGNLAHSDLFSLSLPLFSIANKHFNSLKNTSFYKGVHKVWSLPKLPLQLNKFYNNIIVRALRVLGGICFIIMVSQIYNDWPIYFKSFIDILATIQIIQMVLFGFIKAIYAIYILIYYPELLEIRNSPLDKNCYYDG